MKEIKGINSNKKLSLKDLKLLDDHIKSNFIPNKDADLELEKDIYWAEGFLCAMDSLTDFVKMDDWLPIIQGDGNFTDINQANNIISIIFSFKTNIYHDLQNGKFLALYERHNICNENISDLVIRWSKGYMFALIMCDCQFTDDKTLVKLSTAIAISAGAACDAKNPEKNIDPMEGRDLISESAIAIFNYKKHNQDYDDTDISKTSNDNRKTH